MTTDSVWRVGRRRPLWSWRKGGFSFSATGALLSALILCASAADPPHHDAGVSRSPSQEVPDNPRFSAKLSPRRYCEGAQVADQVGTFKPAGDRVVFVVQGENSVWVVLENLNLERIARAISDHPAQLWKVSGMITECRGTNYILVERANARRAAAGPAPAVASPSIGRYQ